jgi:hypothetical protein
MKKIILILLILFNLYSNAQPPLVQWQKSLGGNDWEQVGCVERTNDGGYIVAGSTASIDGNVVAYYGNWDCFLVKLNASGAVQWSKNYGGSNNDYALSIKPTPDGGFIFVGLTDSNNNDVSGNHGSFDFWVVKTDGDGVVQWQKCLGGSFDDRAMSVIVTGDGGCIVAGYTSSTDGDVTNMQGFADFWVVKLNAQGNIIWQKTLGGSDLDRAYSVVETTDGSIVVAGVTRSTNGNVFGLQGGSDIWVVKLSPFGGSLMWQKCLGGSSDEEAFSIQQTSDEGFIIAGVTNSTSGQVSGNQGGQDFWVVKLNSTGNLVWQKCLGGSSGDSARSVRVNQDGSFIVIGTTNSNNGNVNGNHGSTDIWAVKLNTTGDLLWQKCYGGTGQDSGFSIQQINNDDYILVGSAWSNNGDITNPYSINWPDIWVAQVTPNPLQTINFSDNQLVVSPNPSKGLVNLSFENIQGCGLIKIYNIQGQQLSQKYVSQFEVPITLDISSPTGLYLLQAFDCRGQLLGTKKVIIE